MPKINLPKNYLLGGTNPSVLSGISSEDCRNLMVVDESLVPFHGKGESKILTSPGRLMYKSDQTGNFYIVSERILYQMTSSFVIEKLADINKSANIFTVAELSSGDLSITTGNALYVYSNGTFIQVSKDQGLKIANPRSCVTIDDFIFVADNVRTFQISAANQPLNYSNNVVFEISSKASKIVSLAEINRTLFVIGSSAIERWVIVGGDKIVERDNVFLQPYGLYSQKSFVNKFNMFAGVFISQGGELQVMVMESESSFKLISTPGIEMLIRKNGNIISADLYEIDQNVFYELSFEKESLIYNFATQLWHSSDSPFWQLNVLNNIAYGLNDNKIYEVTNYSNELLKSRTTKPFLYPQRFNVNEFNLFYTNMTSRTGSAKLYGSLDGVQYIQRHEQEISNNYYGMVSTDFASGYQFSFRLETYDNVYWRGINATLEVDQ